MIEASQVDPKKAQTELCELAALCRQDPLLWAQKAWLWGEGPLLKSTGPRLWQAEVLGEVRDHLSSPETRHQPLMISIASGHGIGKSACISILANWAMSTSVGCKTLLTANTGTQLRTKTWPEVCKWFNSSISHLFFDVKAESITAANKKLSAEWRMDRVTWSDHNTDAFQGLHNQGNRILVIFDEASGISSKIFEVTEGALTDEDTEIIWLCFGNPTKASSRFAENFGKLSHRWKTKHIDSRTVEGTNKEYLNRIVADYGEDSDYARVRVRGQFPRAGLNQLIGLDLVENAQKYKAESFLHMPKVLSLDVARFGDDQSVCGWRQGRKAAICWKTRGQDTVATARKTADTIEAENPDAVVVDGDGLGAGVVDMLKDMGYDVIEFHGGARADDWSAHFNCRTEMWVRVRDWLRAGAEIPADQELRDDLVAPEYGFSASMQIQLEKKDDMKSRGLRSPDTGDMLAMTFFPKVNSKQPVNKKVVEYAYPGQMQQSWMG